MEKTKVTLAIDHGSTSTRAVLGDHYVEELNRKFQSMRFSPGDFSSYIFPFEARGPRDPVYLCEQDDRSRRPVSAKYAFYALVNASDELFEQYGLVEELRAKKGDRLFKQRLRRGLVELFSRIANLSRAICDDNNYEIDIIGLSIPSQWTLEFEGEYRSIILKAFGQQYREQIVFVYETEALGHYLCRDYMRKLLQTPGTLNQGGKTVRHDVLLFLDFGGHNTNTCTFNIVYDEQDQPSFYLISTPKGAGGGSEQWEYSVAQYAVQLLENDRGQQLSAKAKREIYDDFNERKRWTGPSYERGVCVLQGQDENGVGLSIGIPPEVIEEQFNAAMDGPLRLARERIEELGAIVDTIKPRVVVSGGTSRHDGLKDKLRRMCQENGIDPPLFTDMWNIKYDSMKIAQGAAYAASNRMTIEEFFERGAAIGVQRQRYKTRCDNHPEGYWDNEAVFALSKETSIAWKGFLSSKDHLRLVCHPFYERQRPPKKLEFYRCYDLLDLGVPIMGRWRIALSFTGSGGKTNLVMKRYRTCWKGKNRRPLYFDTQELPLYHNRAENCIHVGRADEDNTELLEKARRGFPLTASEEKRRRSGKRIARRPTNSKSTRRRLSRRLRTCTGHVDKTRRMSMDGNSPVAEDSALLEDPFEQYLRQTLSEADSQETQVGSAFHRSPEAHAASVNTAETFSPHSPSISSPGSPVALVATASSSLGYIEKHIGGARPRSPSHTSAEVSSYSPSSYDVDNEDDDEDFDYDDADDDDYGTSLHASSGQMSPQHKAALRTPRQSASRNSKILV